MKRVLVTGGSKGMGLAFVTKAVAAGHRVVTLQRGSCEVPEVETVSVDLSSDFTAVREATKEALERLDGEVDWLVLAGGMGAYMGWPNYNPALHEKMMRVNYFGPRWVFHACARALKRTSGEVLCSECAPKWEAFREGVLKLGEDYEAKARMLADESPVECWRCGGLGTTREITDPRGPSRVLWLGSTVIAPPGASGLEDYAATKGALLGSVPSLARHYAKWGIRQIELATSWVDSPMTQAIKDQNPKLYAKIVGFTPLKRMGTCEEAAQAMMFLLEGPEYFHGCRVVMSGGAN